MLRTLATLAAAILVASTVRAEAIDTAPLHRQITAALNNDQPAKAQVLLERWRQQDPRDATYLQLQAHVYNLLGAPAAAVETVTLALRDPSLPEATRTNLRLMRAESLMLCGDFLPAYREYHRLYLGPHFRDEPRQQLLVQLQAARRAHFESSVQPTPPPKLDYATKPADMPPDLAYVMLTQAHAPNRGKRPDAELVKWAVDASRAHPDSPDLARFAVMRALHTGQRGETALLERPGYLALPQLFREWVDENRQRPPAFGDLTGHPDEPQSKAIDVTAENASAFLADLKQQLADTEPQAQRLIQQRDTLLQDIQAVRQTLDGIRVRNGLAAVMDQAEAHYITLRQRVEAWHAASRPLVEPIDRFTLQRALNRIQSNEWVPEAELQPVLDARQARIQALLRNQELMPQHRLNQLRDRWLERYQQVRPLIAIEEAREAKNWQAVLNWSEVWLTTRRGKANTWVHHERHDAATALGDELSATDAVLKITAGDDPPSDRWEKWFFQARNQAILTMKRGRKAIDEGRPVEAGRDLTKAAIHMPAEPSILLERYRLAELFGDARAKVEVLRDYYYVYEPLPVSESEAMNLALQAHDWAFLLALSEPLVGEDEEAAFHHYVAAQALNLQGIVSRTWPLVRGSRYGAAAEPIYERFGSQVERNPLTLTDAHRKQHRATLADPDQPLADRVYAASVLNRDGIPKPVLPIRATDPLYLAQHARASAKVIADLRPGQRIHVGGEAWVHAPPAGPDALAVLRVHGGSTDAMTRLHIECDKHAFTNQHKKPSLRLVEVRHALLRFDATADVVMDANSAMTVYRGGLDHIHRFGGQGLVQSSSLVLYHTAKTANLELDHASWHLDLYAVPGSLAGTITARHGMLFMPSGRITVPAESQLTLDDMVLGWTVPNHDNTPRLLVRDGAAFTARDTRFVDLGTRHISLPATARLSNITTIGDNAPLLIGGKPYQGHTHRYIPNKATGTTHTARTVNQLHAAAAKAKPGDVIVLTAPHYDLTRTLELPDGVELRSDKFAKTVDVRMTVDPKRGKTLLNLADRAVRIQDVRFWLMPRQEGQFAVAGLRDATNLGLVADNAVVLLRNCGFFSHHAFITHFGIDARGDSLILAQQTKLHGPSRINDNASVSLLEAQVVNGEASVTGTGELRAFMADELANPLTIKGPGLTLRAAIHGMRFIDGGGDPVAKQQHARAIAARDRAWREARDELNRQWSTSANIEARIELVQAFYDQIRRADFSENWLKVDAHVFIAKTLNPLLLSHLPEAGRIYFEVRLPTRMLIDGHLDRKVVNAVGNTATGWQAVGLQASQADKDKAAAFFQSFPPGSKYYTVAQNLLNEGKSFEQVKAGVAKAKRDDQRRVTAVVSRVNQAQRRPQQPTYEPAPARRTWQDAYAAYRATRPPLISSRQMNFARQNELRTMRQQNWTMQRNGLRPMYDIPGW
ncbi:MAG: hypothetical protein AAF750_07610 [Planctomycetota bacterium]